MVSNVTDKHPVRSPLMTLHILLSNPIYLSQCLSPEPGLDANMTTYRSSAPLDLAGSSVETLLGKDKLTFLSQAVDFLHARGEPLGKINSDVPYRSPPQVFPQVFLHTGYESGYI